MKLIVRSVVALSVLVAMSACGDDDHRAGSGDRAAPAAKYARGDGAIGMEGDNVVIKAGGTRGRAVVSPDGSLTVGGDAVEVDAAGRAALKAYSAAAVAMKTHAIEIGRTGAKFGVSVVADVVGGLFDEKRLEAVGARAEAGAQGLVERVRELCTRMQTVFDTQQAAAAAVTAFAPYAVLEQKQVRDCLDDIDDEQGDTEDDGTPPEPPVPSS